MQIWQAPISLLVMLIVCRVDAAAPASAGRYLYLVDAGGGITKLDTMAERKIFHYELGDRTGKLKIPPTSGPGALDGCLASQAIYDRAAGRFYTVAAQQYRMKQGGTKDFQVLSFTVPGVRLAGHWPTGKDAHWDEPPYLESVIDGTPKVIAAEDRAEQRKLDVSSFAPHNTQLQNRILESSGDSILLYLFGGDSAGVKIGVAHKKTKTLVELPQLAETHDSRGRNTPGSAAHLTPGGQFVLVEYADRVELFDATTGRVLKDVSKGPSKDKSLVAISPNGRLVFSEEMNYGFVDLSMKFPNVEVVDRLRDTCGGWFFSDK